MHDDTMRNACTSTGNKVLVRLLSEIQNYEQMFMYAKTQIKYAFCNQENTLKPFAE